MTLTSRAGMTKIINIYPFVKKKYVKMSVDTK